MLKVLTAALALHGASAVAQLSPGTFAGVPRWADTALRAAGLDQGFTFSSRMNPALEVGDFDRDGLLDIAVEIRDAGGQRGGIAIVHRIDRSVHIVGAGRPLGDGKDRLARRGAWTVTSRRHDRAHEGFTPDRIYIEDSGRHSGWLVWDGKAYVWIEGE